MISSKLTKGAIISVTARILVNSIGIISTIILARILSPSDYGIFAMIMSAGYLLEIFADVGIGTYLISKSDIKYHDYHTAWTTNFLLFFIIGILYFYFSSHIANFYEKPELELLIKVYSINFFIRSIYNVTIIINDKNLIFKPFFLIQVLPKIISFIVTITLAIMLRDYWALIIGALTYQFSRTLLSYIIHPYKPLFTLKGISSVINYSQWLLLNNITRYLNTKSIDILIGKQSGSTQLGYYTMAYDLSVLPVDSAIDPLNRVLLSGFSKNNQNKNKLAKLIIDSFAVLNIFILPICIGLFLIAPTLIPLALGNKWILIIPTLQILTVGQIFKTLATSISSIFLSLNKPKLVALGGIYIFPIYLISSIFLYKKFGLNGIAISFTCTYVILFFYFLVLLYKHFGFDFIVAFTKNFTVPVISTLIMAILFNTISLTFSSLFLTLVSQISFGILCYGVTFTILLPFNKNVYKPLIEKFILN